MYNAVPNGPVYTASFAASALTTEPNNAFCILASSLSRVEVHEITIGQLSTEQIRNFGVQLLRGSTASSTSAAITPAHIHGWSGVPTAGSSVTGPSSGLASTASAVQIYADASVQHHWMFRPDSADRPIIDVSQRLQVRITHSTTVATQTYGTITFAEIGKPAG